MVEERRAEAGARRARRGRRASIAFVCWGWCRRRRSEPLQAVAFRGLEDSEGMVD